ncbi:MAG: hypothetical protein ACJ76J_22960 [Thermoanaerobaculia bacterium]
MQKLIRNARAAMREVTADLEISVERLKAVHTTLPVSPQEEAMLEGEMEADFATEARAIIECVIPDRLEPAIQALREVTVLRRKTKKGSPRQ